MITINSGVNAQGVPIKIWVGGVHEVESGALTQAKNLAAMPWVHSHVALMGDVHQGYGVPIGCVFLADGVIVPNAVGVDIGCGVVALQTTCKHLPERDIKAILGRIREEIPVGFASRTTGHRYYNEIPTPDIQVCKDVSGKALVQAGTLGGGNHFIELSEDQHGFIWIMIHSGSRNIGYQIAKVYNAVAKQINPTSTDLSWLDMSSTEGKEYFEAMSYALAFAYENRRVMLEICKDILRDVSLCAFEESINIHHNYAAKYVKDGKEYIIHRKGATPASNGLTGIVPGSMGTASYITKGLGNVESFESCSHGAGRKFSRSKANEVITEEEAQASIGNVVYGRWDGDFSECPLAYKDIHEVMANQADLAEAITVLRPLGVVKG